MGPEPEQAGLEAVGERAVEPGELVIATTAKVALVKPSEAQARTSAQLVCEGEPQATFFREFLFCQKRKLPPAGQAFDQSIQNNDPAEGHKKHMLRQSKSERVRPTASPKSRVTDSAHPYN